MVKLYIVLCVYFQNDPPPPMSLSLAVIMVGQWVVGSSDVASWFLLAMSLEVRRNSRSTSVGFLLWATFHATVHLHRTGDNHSRD